ncbi:MAG: hypothetical protein QW473_07120 [Desulfurococcaceae archaeon]
MKSKRSMLFATFEDLNFKRVGVKLFRISIPILIALFLTVITFLLIPVIDVVQLENVWQYPFFYASSLPLIYYLAVTYSSLLALFCRNDYGKLVSLLCVAFLVELTPSLMLVNPWLPDQYPYLAEPVYLVRNSHIAPVHYLHEVPGLGLTFSQLMLVTNLGAYMVSKIYPVLTVLMLVLPTFLMSRELCGNGAIAPLLFLAINSAQINTFHRFSLFFMLFSLALFLVWRRHGEHKSVHPILYIIVFSAATLTYPGYIIIPSLLLLAPIIWLILRKVQASFLSQRLKQSFPESIPTYSLGLISLIIFFSWGIIVALNSFTDIVELVYNAFMELTSPEDPFRILMPRHGFSEAIPTTTFLYILRVRMVLTIALQGLGFLSFISFLLGREKRGVLIHVLYLPLLISYLLFLPTSASQYYTVRAVLYTTLLASLCIAAIWHPKQNQILKIAIIVLMVAGLTLIPITRYASIPYLHPTTQELNAAAFVHQYYVSNQPIYYTEYPPYIGVIVGKDPGWEFTQCFLISEHGFNFNTTNILMSKRHIVRDGYYLFPKPVSITFNYVAEVLSLTHNIVYVNDYANLFVKRDI